MKILLIQLRRIGDLILTTPAIVALRQELPQARIALAVAQECEPLLPAIPGIDNAIIIKRGLGSLAGATRMPRFDCVIDFTRNDRSAWLTFWSRARRRIVSDRLRYKSPLRARFYNEFVNCAMKQMHTADYNLALLEPLGILNAASDPVLEIPASAHRHATDIVVNRISNRPFAIFHPGSARVEKFWEPNRWAEVIAFVENEICLVPILSGGPGEVEKTHLAAIRGVSAKPILDISGQIDLLVLAAMIARARLLVTVDSAPMHLASATKTPQVILFGPTNPFHWRPRGSPAAVLFGDSPSPLRDFQSRVPKLPMKKISTHAVIDAIRSMQSAPAASAV